MSHTATTTITRYFTVSRGRALSAGWFGLSTAEFILPVLIFYLLSITECGINTLLSIDINTMFINVQPSSFQFSYLG